MDILLQQHLQSPLVLSALSTNMAMKQATLFGFLKPKVDESSIQIKEEYGYLTPEDGLVISTGTQTTPVVIAVDSEWFLYAISTGTQTTPEVIAVDSEWFLYAIVC